MEMQSVRQSGCKSDAVCSHDGRHITAIYMVTEVGCASRSDSPVARLICPRSGLPRVDLGFEPPSLNGLIEVAFQRQLGKLGDGCAAYS